MLEEYSEIHSGAEALFAGSGQNQRAERLVVRSLFESVVESLKHLPRKRVALLGTVQGHDEYFCAALGNQVRHREGGFAMREFVTWADSGRGAIVSLVSL